MNNNNFSSEKPHILVIIEPYQEITRLLRSAKRKAQLQNLTWEAVIIETPRMRRHLNKKEQEILLGAMTLAEQMGGVVTKIRAATMVGGIGEVLAERTRQNVPIHSMKIARVSKPRILPRPSLLKKARETFGESYVITAVPIGVELRPAYKIMHSFKVTAEEILVSLAVVTLATLIIYTLRMFEPEVLVRSHYNKAIIYMIACAFPALRYGFLAGMVAAVASFMALNLFFIGKEFSLVIDEKEAGNLLMFLIGGAAIALFGNWEYKNKLALAKTADRFHSLLRLHRITLNKSTADEAVQALDAELSMLLETDIAFFLPLPEDESRFQTLFLKDIELNEEEQKALKVAWEESKTAGVGAPYHPLGCRWRFEPLVTANDEIGVLGVYIGKNVILDTDLGRLLSGIADQAALILERLKMEQIAEIRLIQAEREKLRSMLLSSVSHDLKTPLASVIGSLSVYRSMRTRLPEEHCQTLITTALDEAQRLDSFITNILDMTRLESGQIEMKEEWVAPASLIETVSRRLKDRLRNHTLQVSAGDDNLEVTMDTIMTGQVLQNLLDNAVKYTPAGTQIDIGWHIQNEQFALTVRDYGNGIPDDHLEKIFDKYARIRRADMQVAGTGLGLAVARAIMHAQKGTVTASNHPDGGAVFTIVLPKTRHKKEMEAA